MREQTAETDGSDYAWIITEDHISDPSDVPGMGARTRIGLEGPSDAPEELLVRLRRGEGYKFRMRDDDRNLYYAGRFLDINVADEAGGENAFGPLDDFGTPDAGAVTIEYWEPYNGAHGKWSIL